MQTSQDSWTSPNAMFIMVIMGIFLLAGLLHPEEFLCLVPGRCCTDHIDITSHTHTSSCWQGCCTQKSSSALYQVRAPHTKTALHTPCCKLTPISSVHFTGECCLFLKWVKLAPSTEIAPHTPCKHLNISVVFLGRARLQVESALWSYVCVVIVIVVGVWRTPPPHWLPPLAGYPPPKLHMMMRAALWHLV